MTEAIRIVVAGLAAALLGFAPAAAAPKPMRIMSINYCADLLLLQLVPKPRIASITFLARPGVESLFRGADAGIPINRGTAEDIVNFQPDLILAADVSTPQTRRLAKRVGARIVEVKSATDFAGVRAAIRQVGEATGELARAEALVRAMDAKLARLAANPPARRPRVVAWSGGTTVPGRFTVANAVIEAAGAVNLASTAEADYTSFDVEQLLAADPDALLFAGDQAGPSLQGLEGQHRVVKRRYAGRRIAYNEAAMTCGLPQSADAAVALRRSLDALPERRR